MNWLLILVVALLLGNVLWGYKQGFMRVVLSIVSWVLVLVVCYVVTPMVAETILDKTELQTIVQTTINDKVNEVVANVAEGVADEAGIAELEATLPAEIKEAVLGEHDSLADVLKAEGKIKIDTAPIAQSAASLIALVIVLVVTRLAIFVLDKILGLASKLPLIGSTDKMLGLVAGAAKGLIYCWIVLAVVAMLALTGTNTELIAMVNDSVLLTWLHENNIIVNMLTSVV